MLDALDRLWPWLEPADQTLDAPAEFLPLAILPLDRLHIGAVPLPFATPAGPPLAIFDCEQFAATFLAVDTRRSLGVLLGLLVADAEDDAAALAIQQVADDLGFDPQQLPAEVPLGVLPRVPPGWRRAATADGLCVIAPAAAFAGDQLFDHADVQTADPATEATAALGRGYPATALWLLRQAAAFADPQDRPPLARAAAICRERMQQTCL